jgi:hypothetical protein
MRTRDDGSTMGGIVVVIAVIAAFLFGYYVRDSGYVFQINQSTAPQEIKTK